MKTIEINFTEIQPVDLMGEPVFIPNLYEQLCNLLYKKTSSIRVGDIVRELFYGRSVQADEQMLTELVMESNNCFAPMIQTAVLTYLTDKLNNLKSE